MLLFIRRTQQEAGRSVGTGTITDCLSAYELKFTGSKKNKTENISSLSQKSGHFGRRVFLKINT